MKNLYAIIIFIVGITNSFAQTTLDRYEYWFNNDYINKITASITPTEQLLINQNISTTSLTNGLNILNFRAVNNLGMYSSVLSHFFYKTISSENNPNPKIIAYEYWVDNNYTNAVVINTPVQQQVYINELIAMSSLNNGVHNFNIRFKDNVGLWSNVLSHFFYKMPEQIFAQNEITEYRYWFNNDFANSNEVLLSTPVLQLNLQSNFDLIPLSVGQHTIHFQFKDKNGKWSIVTSDEIERTITLNVEENSFKTNILVYPNPTYGKVQVDLKETHSNLKVLIYDVNGKLVRQTSYKNQQTFEFNFNEPSGIYLITIISEKNRTTIRLIKN